MIPRLEWEVGSLVLLMYSDVSDPFWIILKEWALSYEVNFHCQAHGTIKECNARCCIVCLVYNYFQSFMTWPMWRCAVLVISVKGLLPLAFACITGLLNHIR